MFWDYENTYAIALVSGENFPDSLSLPPAMATLGPTLLVHGKALPASTRAELQRLRPCYIVAAGGTSVVSDAVLEDADQYADPTQQGCEQTAEPRAGRRVAVEDRRPSGRGGAPAPPRRRHGRCARRHRAAGAALAAAPAHVPPPASQPTPCAPLTSSRQQGAGRPGTSSRCVGGPTCPTSTGSPGPPVPGPAVQSGGVYWGFDRLDQRSLPLDRTCTYQRTGRGVTAYVVDSGVRADQIELVGRVARGYDAVRGGVPSDCNGHGTHVAGTLAGRTAGVAKDATVVPVRVFDCAGSGRLSDLLEGVLETAPKQRSGVRDALRRAVARR